jgi:hypothetical protein
VVNVFYFLDLFLIYQFSLKYYFIDVIAIVVQMEIHLKTLTGEEYVLRAKWSSTIVSVKKAIHEKKGIPVQEQRLVFAGKQLDDNLTLADYNIQDKSTILLILRLTGS